MAYEGIYSYCHSFEGIHSHAMHLPPRRRYSGDSICKWWLPACCQAWHEQLVPGAHLRRA
jgi:hypothetical protein